MTDLEASVRSQIDRDLDCSRCALQLISLRRELKLLVGEWKAAGGGDRLPNVGAGLRPLKKEGKPLRMVLSG